MQRLRLLCLCGFHRTGSEAADKFRQYDGENTPADALSFAETVKMSFGKPVSREFLCER